MLLRDVLKYILEGLFYGALVLLLIFLLLTPSSVQAVQFGPYQHVSLVKVKDGDTVTVMVELWPKVYKEIDIRIAGVDTPETRRGTKSGESIPECELVLGQKAKAFATRFLSQGDILLVYILPKQTKYAGRMSGDLMVDGTLLSTALLDSGNAVSYSGGTRKIWPCKQRTLP